MCVLEDERLCGRMMHVTALGPLTESHFRAVALRGLGERCMRDRVTHVSCTPQGAQKTC